MILLDTCTLLWLVADQESLSEKALDAIKNSHGMIFVSAITSFELAIKVRKKKLALRKNVKDWYNLALDLHGISEIPVTSDILFAATSLSDHHRDPADRMILATAKINGLTVVSADKIFKKYRSVKTVW